MSATFHTPGHLIIWPYGWTSDDSRPEMTRADHRVFVALGTAAAKRNDYLPLQWGTGRRTSGSAIDWQYGDQRIFSFLIEMGDKLVNPESVIGPEVRRNYDALLYLMEQADCPYRVIGKAQEFCGPLFDDFETSRGWVRDPDHSDGATDGAWARGNPRADANQPSHASSGEGELATGLRAGHDVDGGTTTIRSTLVSLPAGATHLRFRYRARLSANAAPTDGLNVQLVYPRAGALHRLMAHGTGSARSIGWTSADLPIPASLRNQRVAIQFTATDGGASSTVEAGVDDVRITAPCRDRTFVTRGFVGRRGGAPADRRRLPPGQYLTNDYPVLSAGPTPHTPLDRWTFTIEGLVREPVTWSWQEFTALPAQDFTVDISCVTKWTHLDMRWRGVSLDVLLEHVQLDPKAAFAIAYCDGGYTTNLPIEDIVNGQSFIAWEYDG